MRWKMLVGSSIIKRRVWNMSWSVDKSWITRIEIVGRVGRHGNKGKILEHGDCATPGPRVKTKSAA